ncbi:DUF3054 domain-containing protein [Natronococcus wangiae]|uniref:DUF3054 domain-containing protein n=1 Tax=Natronococcus wangiae TaxID=3068275 RepID=UPI00273FA151|nr:DUF3054 domain-containing protein [Natronococcus sp. AD5]
MDAAVRSEKPGGILDRETIALGGVDVTLLAGIILVGQRSHGVSLLTEPLVALETVVPFLAGWLVMAALAGVYAPDVSSSVTRAVRVTTVAWIAAANVGLILRASPLFNGGATWPFPLVMTGFGLLVLGGWRVGYAAYAGSRS